MYCSECGAPTYYDGRNGDGHILTCGCDQKGHYVNEGSRGGYYVNNARPVPTPPKKKCKCKCC